ncbi:hypothetical protein [Pseudomonas nunensis]|uniref:Uncharacterized protein n=1 Tax=Pseudomonas nunensis TaxID=2961896 RepID=A0ABY5EJM4_9PSED|nr:hypothetical protein [Pseudomonas nunensis]KPN93419.1 hypothetical protein AL066_00770 [Pseudomonas nunensis]MCL5228182.1 hypothetical protein [Pseudomonas nunensis]UTO14937.1 hypothetical protein NK667_00810 [Pseudomonas nunensis]
MLNTLQNTPLWVYGILLLLFYYGIKALSPTREGKTSMLVTPPILLAWSLYSLNLTLNPTLSISSWMVAFILGSLAALAVFKREGIELDDPQSGLIIPGTLKTIVLYLMFFAANYYFGYQDAVHPLDSTLPKTLILKASVSGFVCGILSGRALKFYRIFMALKAQHQPVRLR